MNENQTSPIESLRAGLSDLGHEVSVEPKATTASQNQSNRGTTNAEGNEQPNNNAEASTNTDAEASSASVSDSSINGESTDSANQPQQKQKQRQGSVRIQELANDNRALKEKLASLEAKIAQPQQAAKATETPAKPREIVPKPQAPTYDRKELASIAQQLSAKVRLGQATEQEIGIYDAALVELKNWDKYDIQSELWELKNGQAAKEQDGYKAHYQQEALKQYPALNDPNSEHTKLFTSTRNRLEEIAKNLDVEGDYWAAMVSDLVIGKKKYASETGALKTENEKLRKEIDALKGKLEPMETSEEEAEVVSKGSGASESPIQAFKRKAREFRRNNPLAA